LLQEDVTCVEGGIIIEQVSKLLQRDAKETPSKPVMVMRGLTSNTSRLYHRDIANVSNEARGIFLERRRRSSSERLFKNFLRYLKYCFATGESPVTVILKSSNLNVH
jgi:hypothetical protein